MGVCNAPRDDLDLPPLATVQEAQKVLRCGRNLIYRMVAKGDLKAVRLGRKLFIPRAVLERLVDGAA